MSEIVIAGNTSGSVTIAAPDVAGTTTLTLPATSGALVTDNGSGTVTATAFVGDGSGLTGIAGGFSNMEVFTSSGTFTVPAGITKVKVTVVGAGGGTCGVVNTGSNYSPGGGGGGTAIKVISGLTPLSTVAVTVGTSGAGYYYGTGPTGGTSSFGAHCSATGGGGGAAGTSSTNSMLGGAGGIGTGGDLNIRGGGGGEASGPGMTAGRGGDSSLGGSTQTQSAGAAYGAGGGGQRLRTNLYGYAGASGVVIVEY